METFDSLLEQRFPPGVRRRIATASAADSLPEPLTALTKRQLFRWPYRHMKKIAGKLQFTPTANYGWEIHGKGFPTVQLEGLPQWANGMKPKALIVASGPSAKEYDFDSIDRSQVSIFALSGSVSFLAERGILPDYWIISDNSFARHAGQHFEVAKEVPLVTTHAGIKLIADCFPQHLSNRKVAIIERINQWHGLASLSEPELLRYNKQSGSPFHFPEGINGKSIVGWSDRPELGFFSGSTVAFVALQIAAASYAREIEIIGMDLSSHARCYSEGDKPIANNLVTNYEKKILPSFQVMNRALRGKETKVTNLSEVCPLPPDLFDFRAKL